MAAKRIDIQEFIRLASTYLVIDVRSPKEYRQAHFPGAVSIPLFSDEERKQVGTTYKQQSREAAIKIGLDFYGPKMREMLSKAETLLDKRGQKKVIVHCWRGGMRSAAVAWLLDLYGFDVYTLEGGYKSFRNWALAQFEKKYNLHILGGNTGSGKTEILQEFKKRGLAVIDLEGLAQHKGSAFGNLDNHPQNSTEHFENELALALYRLTQEHSETVEIWLESESSRIGQVNIPHRLFDQMKLAQRTNIEVPFEERLNFICKAYGQYSSESIIEATKRIKKRLGGLRMQQCIEYIEQGDLKSAFRILLAYYDKAYDKSRQKFAEETEHICLPSTHHAQNANLLIEELGLTILLEQA